MKCPDSCGWYTLLHVGATWDEDMLLVVWEDDVRESLFLRFLNILQNFSKRTTKLVERINRIIVSDCRLGICCSFGVENSTNILVSRHKIKIWKHLLDGKTKHCCGLSSFQKEGTHFFYER